MKKNNTFVKMVRLTAVTAMSACIMFGTAYAAEGTKTVFVDDEFTGWTAGINTTGGLKSMNWSGSYAVWTPYGSVNNYKITLMRDDQKVVIKYVRSQTRINLDEYMHASGSYTFRVQVETGWGWSKPYVSKVRTARDAAYAKQQGHTISTITAETKEVPLDDPAAAVGGDTQTETAAEADEPETTAAESESAAAESETAAAESESAAAETETAAAESESAASEEAAQESSAAAEGQWLLAEDGSGRWWYRNADGSYPALAWLEKDGKKYYFDSEGWMVTGTLEIDGKTCSFDDSGAYME